jgi:2'-5' RNA ligase
MEYLILSQLYTFYTTTMKYRYYIGLQLPPDLSDEIVAIQRDLFDPIESITPLEPHVTLLPPPAVEHIEPYGLATEAKVLAKEILPITLELTEVITFNGHAVALKVTGDDVFELQDRLVGLLPQPTEVTYFPHPQFVPHVTLVQALHGKTLPSKLVQAYKDELSTMLPMTFTVEQLTLFEWTSPRKYNAQKI